MDNLSTGAQQVLDALTQIGQGTVADIREKTGKSARVTDKAIRELADAGLIAETDPGDGNPPRWSIAAAAAEPTNHDHGPDAQPGAHANATHDEPVDTSSGDPASTSQPGQLDEPSDLLADAAAVNVSAAPADDTADNGGSGTPADDSDTHTEPVPARPRPPADRKVLAVAGVLGDYPNGATFDEIAAATGYNVGVVARLLQAMEQADAVRRIPEDPEANTPQRWQPGPGKASDVDPNPAPPRCPTCGQVIRPSTPKAATSGPRSGGSGTVNADGNEPLGRNVLRGWVHEYIDAHPGHDLTPGTIADALGAQHGRTISPGAVLNNCRTLAMNGQIQMVRQEPFTVTTNPNSGTDSDQP